MSPVRVYPLNVYFSIDVFIGKKTVKNGDYMT